MILTHFRSNKLFLHNLLEESNINFKNVYKFIQVKLPLYMYVIQIFQKNNGKSICKQRRPWSIFKKSYHRQWPGQHENMPI